MGTFTKELNDFLNTDEQTDDVGSDQFSTLTRRERELLDCIARGLTNPQIAASLHIAEKTVRNHITSVFSKLGAEHRAQAIVLARRAGFGRE